MFGLTVGSAWKFGPPIDRHGQPALDESGSPDLQAQPPCLLRYSPSLFAKDAPAVFQYDEATNRLAMKPGQTPPWLRPSEGGRIALLHCQIARLHRRPYAPVLLEP